MKNLTIAFTLLSGIERMKLKSLTLLFISFHYLIFCQNPMIEWEKCFGGSSNDNANSIITTNALRSLNNIPIHEKINTNITQAKEAMVDSLLLSKCDFVIKTSSALSDWVKIWNPSIEVYNLNKFKETWFPQAIIPVKSFLKN
jgi:hypothetical protein